MSHSTLVARTKIQLRDHGAFVLGYCPALMRVIAPAACVAAISIGLASGADAQQRCGIPGGAGNAAGIPCGYWDGNGPAGDGTISGGDGVWNNSNTNWTDSSGNSNGTWRGISAIFQGTPGNVSVEGVLNFTGMQFLTDGYRIVAGTGGVLNTDTAETNVRVGDGVTATIDVSIQGSGGLVKQEGGTLVLATASDLVWTVEGGELILADDMTDIGETPFLVTDGAQLTVAPAGSITTTTPSLAAVRLEDNSVLLVQGEINSAGAGVSGTGGGTVTVDADGSISGFGTAIDITGDAGEIVNAGMIAASGGFGGGTGIRLGDGGTVINNAGGVVRGELTGITIFGEGTVTNNAGALVDGGVSIIGSGTVINAGSITTSRNASRGIHGRGTEFDIQVLEGGTIATSGRDSDGIYLSYTGSDVIAGTVRMDGAITTTGDLSDGIWVGYGAGGGGGGGGNISVGGTIDVSGADASGIYAYLRAGSAVAIDLTAGGSISATGAEGHGIYLASGGGSGGGGTANATINVASGARVFAEEDTTIAEGNAGGTSPFIDTELTIAGEVARPSVNDTAIDLDTGNDRLELQPGFVIVGRVDGGLGSDVFALGGAGADSFDFGLIGGQYNAFEAFEKVGTSDWELTGTNAIDADFTVREGLLRANGTFAATDFTVLSGARLGGTGTIGGVTVTGGTLAPGNSIGTLTVGSLSFDAASIFEVEVNDQGGSDRVVVNGTVTLGGATLSVLDMAGGAFAGNDPFNYLIIDNDGADAVAGTFGTVTNQLAFLTPTVSYSAGDGNDVRLTLTPNNATPEPPPGPLFPTAAVTYNQISAATGLEALDRTAGSDANAVYMQILFMTAPQARAAFDASSGEIYASLLAGSAAEGARRADRLVARGHESMAEGWGLWGGATARGGSVEGDGNAAEVDGDGYGLDLGIDYRGAGNAWALGAAVGYIDGALDVDARGSSARYDGWHVGAYGRYGTGNAGLTASVALDYGEIDARVTRRIAFGTIARTATAPVDIDSFALAGELRYGLAVDGGWAVGPVASVRHGDGDLGPLGESGADSLNLSGGGASDGVTRFGGGLFANWQGLRGSLDVAAQYVDGSGNFAEVPLTLAGAPGQTFGVRSPRTGGAAGLFSLAGRRDLGGGWSIGGEARALIGRDEQDISGSLVVGRRF